MVRLARVEGSKLTESFFPTVSLFGEDATNPIETNTEESRSKLHIMVFAEEQHAALRKVAQTCKLIQVRV